MYDDMMLITIEDIVRQMNEWLSYRACAMVTIEGKDKRTLELGIEMNILCGVESEYLNHKRG